MVIVICNRNSNSNSSSHSNSNSNSNSTRNSNSNSSSNSSSNRNSTSTSLAVIVTVIEIAAVERACLAALDYIHHTWALFVTVFESNFWLVFRELGCFVCLYLLHRSQAAILQ